MSLKFVKKSLENKNFSKLFPLKDVKHGMKFRKEEYFVNPSKTKRWKESAVPYLQELLNKDYFEKKQSLRRLLDIESSERVGKVKRIESIHIGSIFGQIWSICPQIKYSTTQKCTVLSIAFGSHFEAIWAN